MYPLQIRRVFYRQIAFIKPRLWGSHQINGGLPLEASIMRHPALRRSARHSKRDSRPGSGTGAPPVGPDPAAQNRAAPDYQRDLGSEQDA
jgi:hypothetical protein